MSHSTDYPFFVGTIKKNESFQPAVWLAWGGWKKLYTISELHSIIQYFVGKDDVNSERHMKDLLIARYSDHLVLSQVAGHTDVVCFKDMASTVLNEKWYSDRCSDEYSEQERIVVAAAKLIHSQVRDTDHSTTNYPKTDFDNIDSAKKWIPSLLNTFMEHIVAGEMERVAISHAIVQAAKSRSAISPLLFGVGVALDHAFDSRWLVEMLPKLGFSLTYDEVNRYKQAVVQVDESSHLPPSFPQGFT
jgi:hypothetical protein